MKNLHLFLGLALLCLFINLPMQAATAPSHSVTVVKNEMTEKTSNEKIRKAKKWEKGLNRFVKRMEKKLNRLHKKGKLGTNIGLGFVGLTVLGVGGLFIWAGLAIPFVGWLFVGIGAIVALVGLLLTFILDGIRVSVN